MSKKNEKILPVQIQKIHIAKKQLNLSDDEYRTILGNFKNAYNHPSKSSKELNKTQGDILLQLLKTKLNWRELRKGTPLKYEELASRDPKFATPAQLRKIEAEWKNNSREKTEQSLNHFIQRVLKINHITFILKKDVNRLLKAIESLNKHEPNLSTGREEEVKK